MTGSKFRPKRNSKDKTSRKAKNSGRNSNKPSKHVFHATDKTTRPPLSVKKRADAKPQEQNPQLTQSIITEPMRVAKAIARAGISSRRDAERLIAKGRVRLNGQILQTPAKLVSPGDRLEVDGKIIEHERAVRLWRFHKPKGCLTTSRDPDGRRTIYDNLSPEHAQTLSIGRLDFNTEGLLLMTNHGGLSRHLELPKTGVVRQYRVRVAGQVTQTALDRLAEGMTVEKTVYAPVTAVLDRQQGHNAWLTLDLTEGKNREIRVLLSHLGLEVNRLIRVQYGPFSLGDLRPGEISEIPSPLIAQHFSSALGLPQNVSPRQDAPQRRNSKTPASHRKNRTSNSDGYRHHRKKSKQNRSAKT